MAFIAAIDGSPGPLAAFAGLAGDIRRVATTGEALQDGKSMGRFALNAVAVAGPGGALHLCNRGSGIGGAHRDLLLLYASGSLRDSGPPSAGECAP